MESRDQRNQLVRWNDSWKKFDRTQFSITFTNKQEIFYIKNGKTLRIVLVKGILIQPQVINYLQQIKYFYWSGNYGQNNQKNGRWNAIWDGKPLNDVGGEYIDGRKLGQWKDLTQNYWSLAQAYEIGQYDNEIRKGAWKLVYENKKMHFIY